MLRQDNDGMAQKRNLHRCLQDGVNRRTKSTKSSRMNALLALKINFSTITRWTRTGGFLAHGFLVTFSTCSGTNRDWRDKQQEQSKEKPLGYIQHSERQELLAGE